MKFIVKKHVPEKFDTAVVLVKAGEGVNFSCPLLKEAYESFFAGDDLKLKVGEVKTTRMKYKDFYVNLVMAAVNGESKAPYDDFRKVVLKIGTALQTNGAEVVVFDDPTAVAELKCGCDVLLQVTTHLPLCEYKFDDHKSKKTEVKEKTVHMLSDEAKQHRADEGNVISEGIAIARKLTSEPAETLTPAELANRATAFGKEFGFDVQVFGKDECEKMGMSLFLAVARASKNEPKLIVMRYNGGEEGEAPFGIVGKGLTYDSGGLAIKPGAGMATMSGDMAGSSAAVGAMCTIAKNKVKKNVVAVVAACENMVDANGYRNGDIFPSMNGKTVYIGNTDAEGRLTLADAITYIIRHEKVTNIIELSTLTGSTAMFFGNVCAGLHSTCDEMYANIEKIMDVSGEKFARFPRFPAYKEMIKNPFADLANTTQGAGGITAAMFLEEFAEDVPYVHMDIAGSSYARAKSDCQPEGGTGFGVKTLYYYVKNLAGTCC